MVSSVLNMGAEEVLAALRRMSQEYQGDPEYAEVRAQLPADWPI